MTFARNYSWEVLGLIVLGIYGLYFFQGRRKNALIVNNWLKQYRPLLEENFSSVGISGTYGLFMRESFDQFRLFCSGRKNCRGMLFDFKLKKRQDLFSLLLDFITPVDDIMTVDIPLDPESVQPFVFALCRKRDYKSVHSENGDLKDLGHQIALQYTPELSKASGHWVVISDNTEVPSLLLSRPVVSVVKVSNSLLRLIHVSDHMPPPTDNRSHLADCAIRIKAKLPAYDRMEVLEDVMKMVFQITDAVASVRLSPKAQAAVAKVRAELDKKQLREEHSARQERMKQLKEQKMKEERERMEKMAPEVRAKYEEKLEKEERKKKMKKRVKIVKM